MYGIYVVPEIEGIAIIELLRVAATVAVISSCFINVQHTHPKIGTYMILQRTKFLEPVSTESDAEPQSELHGVRVSRVFIYSLVLI